MNEEDDRSRERRWALAAHMTAVAYEILRIDPRWRVPRYLIDRYFGTSHGALIACILLGTDFRALPHGHDLVAARETKSG